MFPGEVINSKLSLEHAHITYLLGWFVHVHVQPCKGLGRILIQLKMCIPFIVFGITHYGKKPSNHYNWVTTRILRIIPLLILILQALPPLTTDHYCNNVTLDDTIWRHNSEIFDKIGHLGNITEAQWINKMRGNFNKLEKIAVKSVQSTKYAMCSIIEVTNRLGSISLSSSNSNIQASAIEVFEEKERHQPRWDDSHPVSTKEEKL